MKTGQKAQISIASEMLFLGVAMLCAIFCAWSFWKAKERIEMVRTQNRAPAALESNPALPTPSVAPVPQEKNAISELQFVCWSELGNKSLKTSAGMLSLRVAPCKNEKAPLQVSGLNQNNSFEIQFMSAPKDGRWVSNFFRLEPGKNRIELTLAQPGSKTRQVALEILRE